MLRTHMHTGSELMRSSGLATCDQDPESPVGMSWYWNMTEPCAIRMTSKCRKMLDPKLGTLYSTYSIACELVV
jgi:hypothetical protein